MRSPERLHVAINARVSPGAAGGILQSTVGLIHALGKLEDGNEQYTLIVGNNEQRDWLKSYCGPNQRIAVCSKDRCRNGRLTLKRILKAVLEPVKQLVNIPEQWPGVPVSDGFIESLGCEVMHFPTQTYMLCALPTIYNPHDLQHLHYPQFFTPQELVWRETVYPAGCRYSQTVVVGTQWIKDDVVRRYSIDPEKVQVIPWASPTQFYRNPEPGSFTTVLEKHGLERPFVIYPAVTWPHKNHLRLLDALAYLRDKGLTIRLVCTGARYEPFHSEVEKRISELSLGSQVKFLGFVPDEELRALYRMAQFLVMPTLYEADSCPIYEAWHEGLPVASSNVTALPDQVQDAGLLFDPKDVLDIADAIKRMATNEELRDDLRERGYRRVGDFDWVRTAKAYRALYRRAADRPLTEEDRLLLDWDWMLEPDKAIPARR